MDRPTIGLNRETIHPDHNAIHMDGFAIHMGRWPFRPKSPEIGPKPPDRAEWRDDSAGSRGEAHKRPQASIKFDQRCSAPSEIVTKVAHSWDRIKPPERP